MYGLGNAIGTGIVISLVNDFSQQAKQIAKDFMEMTGISEQAQKRMQSAVKQTAIGFGMAGLGGAIVGTFMAGASVSMRLEEGLADVRKTTGMAADEASRLKSNLFALDSRTGIDDLIKISAIGGQLGIAKKQIEGFTNSVDKITVALSDEFKGGAEEVSKTVGILRNTFSDLRSDDVGADLLKIGNSLNSLSASGFATGDVVSDFATRIGGVGIPLGLSSGQVLGLSASLQELGVTAERGGTAVSRVFKRMLNDVDGFSKFAGVSASEFREVLQSNDPKKGLFGAFKMVTEAAKNYGGDAEALELAMDGLKLSGIGASEVFLKLSSRMDLLNEKTDLATEALKGTDSIMSEFNIKNNTTGAMVDKMKKSFEQLADSLGQIFLPVIQPVVQAIAWFVRGLSMLAQTTVGQVVLRIAAGVGILATSLGVFLVLQKANTLASMFLGSAMKKLGYNFIATTFANYGLIAGLEMTAVAAWSALAPLLPIVAVLAGLAAGYFLVSKSMKAFNDMVSKGEEPAQGWLGVLQKIGGVITGLKEIWNSATSDGFEMNVDTVNALDKMGLKDFVLNMGTWLVRIKEILRGVWDAFKSSFEAVYGVIQWAWNGLGKIFNAFGINIAKLGGDMENFRLLGKVFGYTMVAIMGMAILPMIIAFGSLAVAVIAATYPFILIAAAIYGVWKAIEWLLDSKDAINNWLHGINESIVNWGHNFVEGLKNGVRNAWESFKSMFVNLIASLPGGQYLLDFFADGQVTTPDESSGGTVSQAGEQNAQARIAASTGGGTTNNVIHNNTETVREIVLQVDGQKMAKVVDKHQQTQARRK